MNSVDEYELPLFEELEEHPKLKEPPKKKTRIGSDFEDPDFKAAAAHVAKNNNYPDLSEYNWPVGDETRDNEPGSGNKAPMKEKGKPPYKTYKVLRRNPRGDGYYKSTITEKPNIEERAREAMKAAAARLREEQASKAIDEAENRSHNVGGKKNGSKKKTKKSKRSKKSHTRRKNKKHR
jgi:hypothetical protein